jgi:hypothetical protein
MVERLIPTVREVGDELLASLSEDEKRALTSSLQRVLTLR